MRKKKVKVQKQTPTPKKQASKRPRRFSYRVCPYCEILNDSRFKICTDCDSPLYEEKPPKPPKNHEEVDWTGLQKGDEVYIICMDVWLSPKGHPIYMGDSGEFKVIKITSEGLLVYGTNVGFAYFNMVWAGTMGETRIRRGNTKVYKRTRRRGN